MLNIYNISYIKINRHDKFIMVGNINTYIYNNSCRDYTNNIWFMDNE